MAAIDVSQLMRCLYRVAGVTGLLLWGCGDAQEVPSTDPVVAAFEAGWNVDTVGVANIAEGDTINLDVGLTIIETTRIFPPEANGGEVFAWEFEARELTPVKLLIVRAVDGGKNFELIGESPGPTALNCRSRFRCSSPASSASTCRRRERFPSARCATGRR